MQDNICEIIPNIIGQFNLQYCSVTNGEVSHIIMMLPYSPYSSYPENCANIDAFYEASNRLYHTANKIKTMLNDSGVQVVESGHLELKKLAESGGLGTILKNQLLATKDYGTRITLQDITVKGVFVFNPCLGDLKCSSSCHCCDNACPTKSLVNGVFDRKKCLRHIQDNPEFNAEMRSRVLGCEECQNACPHNAKVCTQTMPENIAKILDIDTLLSNISKGKRSMVEFMNVFGFNYSKPSWVAKLIMYSLISKQDYSHRNSVQLLLNHQNNQVAELAKNYVTRCDKKII